MNERPENIDARKPPANSASRWRFVADFLFLAALALGIAWAYAPSLDHAHRADQWYYFLDTMDCEGLGDTFLQTYSYNRIAKSKTGDTALFRPVLFAGLAAERAAFGYEPRGWHVVGIVLHAVVTVLCFLLARTLLFDVSESPPTTATGRLVFTSRRLVPYVVTSFFALNFAIVEQVIWSHVNIYMLFLALVLGAMLLLFRIQAGRPNQQSLAAAWGMLLVAAFTYEIGQAVAVLMAGYLFLGRKSARPAVAALAFCCIPIVYQATNRIDAAVHRAPLPEHDSVVRAIVANPLGVFANLGHYGQYVGLQPFDSGADKAVAGSRLRIGERDYADVPPDATTIAIWCFLAAILGTGMISLARSTIREGLHGERVLRLGVLVGIGGLYAAAIVLGRMGPRGHGVLVDNSYYAYPALCVILLIACLAMSESYRLKGFWVGLPVVGLMIAMAGRTAFDHVAAVRATNERMRDWSAHEVREVRTMLTWIETHRREPGFSLAFDTQPCGSIGKVHGIAKLWIVAREWTGTAGDNTYVVLARGDRVRLVTRAEYDRLMGTDALNPFVELVEADSTYNTFRHGDRYFGVPNWEGSYDPRRETYRYLLVDSTPERIRLRRPAMHERQDWDIASGKLVLPKADGIVEEGFQEFNVLRIDGHYFAIRQGTGAFDLAKHWRGELKESCDAPDLPTVKRHIASLNRARAPVYSRVPLLVESNHRGYNIIQFRGRFYGIRQADGAFDPQRFRDGRYRDATVADTVPAVKRQIRSLTQSAGRERTRL